MITAAHHIQLSCVLWGFELQSSRLYSKRFSPHPWHLSIAQVSRPQWAWAAGLILTLSCTTDAQLHYALVLQDQDTLHSLSFMNRRGSPWYDTALSFHENHSALSFLGNERKGEDRVSPMPSMGKMCLAVHIVPHFPSPCVWVRVHPT